MDQNTAIVLIMLGFFAFMGFLLWLEQRSRK